MATITIQCPHCQKTGDVPETVKGREVGCNGCGKKFAAIPVRTQLAAVAPSASSRKWIAAVLVGVIVLAGGSAAYHFAKQRPFQTDLRSQALRAVLKGDPDAVRRDCDFELSRHPDNDDALAARAYLYTRRACQASELRKADTVGAADDFAAAIKDIDKAVALQPTTTAHLKLRGEIYHDLFFEAKRQRGLSAQLSLTDDEITRRRLADFDSIIRLEPQNGFARVQRADMHFAAGRIAEALTDAEAVLSIDSNDPFALIVRAKCRLANNDRKGAEADFRTAIRSGYESAKSEAAASMPDVFGSNR